MVSRAELEEFRQYFECSLLSLVRGASVEAKKDVDSARSDFIEALQSFRDDTLEALTALHERADLLLENQFRLQNQFVILQQRLTRLEGEPDCTDGPCCPDGSFAGEMSSRPTDPDDRSRLGGPRGGPYADRRLPGVGSRPSPPPSFGYLRFRSAPPLPESGIPCPPVNRHVHLRPPALAARAAPFTPPFQALPELQAAPPLPNPQGMVVSVSNKRPRASKQDGRGMQAIRAHSAACSQIAVNLMLQLLAFLGSESSFFSAIQSAVHFDAHVRRVLAGFAATTVIRYITTFNSFAKACEDLDVCLLEITAVQAADILVTLQLQRQEDPTVGSSAITCIKAVRWVCKNTQCIVFEVFYGELISSFLKTKLPKDRRESLPLPLYALVQWERRILQRSTPVRDIVLLGAFLVTCWASLRFADSQRIEWRSFAFDVVSLRAIAYQTKTSHQGQPFGLITQGFLHHGTHSWVARWLRVLDSIASQEVRDFGVAPSFLFPALDDDAELLRPLEPMSYPSCLRWLRYYLQFPWMVSPPEVPVSNYTVHSMKCSLLSYMLEVPDIRGPDRDAQGHHRGSSRELYSRDDVLGALRAQTQLRSAVLADFRPRTPLHRGAQLPMAPIPFTLEAFSKEIDPAPWGFFSFDVGVPGSLPWVPGQSSACAAETPAAEASTKAAEPSLPDSASEAGSESSLESEAGPASLGPPDEVHMVAATGVVHAACPSGERTLCGIGMSGPRWQSVHSLSSKHVLCRRNACVNAFAALEA
ncbi:unnamed protein product [Symbiodinium sp. CCMP2592]|nr:unnamed protein product [Symbiodinium sp. CCMP2592]